MKIGELAKEVGVSRDTIRYYEKSGLLIGINQPYELNNYKDYGAENVGRIRMIKMMKKLGFSLKECNQVLKAIGADQFTQSEQTGIVSRKLKEIDEKIAELQRFKSILENYLDTRCEIMPDINDQSDR